MGWGGVGCAVCPPTKLVIMSVPASKAKLPADIREFLDHIEACENDLGSIKEWAANYARSHRRRIRQDVEAVRQRQPNSILNIGGAPYLFEFLMQRAAPTAELVSIDLDPDRMRNLIDSLRLNVLAYNIETDEIPAFANRFDAVVLAEVVEHFRQDLLGTIKRVAGFLSPGGFVLITTPNGLSHSAYRRILRGYTGPPVVQEWRKLSTIGHMGHVREYSAKELREVCNHCGLKIESLTFEEPYSAPRGSGVQFQLTKLRRRMMPSLGRNITIVARRA